MVSNVSPRCFTVATAVGNALMVLISNAGPTCIDRLTESCSQLGVKYTSASVPSAASCCIAAGIHVRCISGRLPDAA